METLLRVESFSFPRTLPIPNRSLPNRIPTVSALRTTPPPVSEVAEEDVLQTFFKERQLNGDLVSKVSDVFWKREFANSIDADDGAEFGDTPQLAEQALQNDSDRRRKLNLLQYEAMCTLVPLVGTWQVGNTKMNDDSLSLPAVTEGINAVIHWYWNCMYWVLLNSIVIPVYVSGYGELTCKSTTQAAISYATGVLFSCLYLKLLYQQADNISRDAVPQIFRQRKTKKIGIRSEDLEDFLEKTIKGCGIALSSPRLVIPAAIYGLWILSHQKFAGDLFDFQLVPAMLGLFVYKAAALYQVYRDNEDLQFIFPDNEEGSK
ncbi:hypothetical protein C1H46_003015 [Malus baccata]|uniref:Uncharacterized protein n=1 Tax=Malus baccata TaxID=106549 RepID=A0A540NK82_MALBA|nr:hypothetical protein C1H46_003015 [Malus baccata]